MTSKVFLLTSVLLVFMIVRVSAHPHVFVTPEATLHLTEGIVSDIAISWKFDKGWSYNVLSQCDRDKDGHFNREETKLVFTQFFSGIEQYDYFTDIRVDDRKITIKGIEQFQVSVNEDKTVIYTFEFPTRFPVAENSHCAITIRDTTLFFGFAPGIQIRTDTGGSIANLKTERLVRYGLKAEFDLLTGGNVGN